MNRLEYNEVMKAVEIPLHWHNFSIYFGGTYYAVVEGNIPLEVANAIYVKYPSNPYGIRVNGGCNDWNPNEIYPTYYHIDSKEGLVIFITEMKDYFARKNGLAETEVQKFDELMANINFGILKKVNPSISTYEWMQADEENSEIFFQTVSSKEKTPFGKEFRKAIDDFDKTINPFINQDVELDEIGSYLQKVNIRGEIFDSKYNGKKRNNCCQMKIILESRKWVSYFRYPNGFSYQLDYIIGKEQYLTVLHNYSSNETDEIDNGEVITIDYWGDNMPQKIDISYNLTKGIVSLTRGQITPITLEQEKIIYYELLNAICLASTITLDNMKKKGVPRQLLSNN